MMKDAWLTSWGFGLLVLAGLGCSDGATAAAVGTRSQGLSLRARDVGTPAGESSEAPPTHGEEAGLAPEPEPEAEPDPDEGSGVDPDGCNCIFFPPSALESCSAERLFCNSSLECRCAPGSPAGAAQSAAATLAPVRVVQGRARPITQDHGSGESLASVPPPPLSCVCLAGTPSPPEGGCPEEDWYCNRSGRCQCDS